MKLFRWCDTVAGMNMQQEIIHARQKSFHPTDTLCGKKPGVWEPGETALEIPEPQGIADPNWISCPECRKKLALPDMARRFVL
jgi:hypothetical protein